MPRKKTVIEEPAQSEAVMQGTENDTVPMGGTVSDVPVEDANEVPDTHTPELPAQPEAETLPEAPENSNVAEGLPDEPFPVVETAQSADLLHEAAEPPDAGIGTENSAVAMPTASAPDDDSPVDAPEERSAPAAENTGPGQSEAAERPRSFFDLDYNRLDRDLSPEERQEWNSIYASYRSRSMLTGEIIGVDDHSFSVRNRDTGVTERRVMPCAIVIAYRVKVLIPETEMWFSASETRPDFVLRNMVGAKIDYVILQVDREGGVAIASRRMAMRSRRYQLNRLTGLHKPGALTQCRLLSVGPRRCLAECHGFDIGMTQREMRYTAIPDLRTEYHPGQELDCRILRYDQEKGELRISVKEVHPHPFEGAELRHPVGSRRQAVIAGKYAGGVFCNLPDGTVCMSLYSSRHDDADFQIGDKVILVIRQYDNAKKQIYGKIVSKW